VGLIIEQRPREMFCSMPVIWMETTKETKFEGDDDDDDNDGENDNKINLFECPVFKTLKRTGIISSSGTSDNYVISVVIINLYFLLILLFY
jgi:hypothetical protein